MWRKGVWWSKTASQEPRVRIAVGGSGVIFHCTDCLTATRLEVLQEYLETNSKMHLEVKLLFGMVWEGYCLDLNVWALMREISMTASPNFLLPVSTNTNTLDKKTVWIWKIVLLLKQGEIFSKFWRKLTRLFWTINHVLSSTLKHFLSHFSVCLSQKELRECSQFGVLLVIVKNTDTCPWLLLPFYVVS